MQYDSERDAWISQGLEWADGDPETNHSVYLRQLIENGDWNSLRDCFFPKLEFGTAGLRGVVGPGPARMNLAVVRRVTLALAEVVRRRAGVKQKTDTLGVGPFVLGYDGRIDSERFAREAVGTLCAAGAHVAFFDRPVPTPLVAFAAQRLLAPAAIVVTASHNPPEYNGYKVYGADAIQIIPPFDREVTEELERSVAARSIPVADAFFGGNPMAQRLDDEIGREYVEAVLAGRTRDAKAEPIRISYSALHGVGASWVERVLRNAGYDDIHLEPSQCAVDGHFPTVRFPNPEEATTLELGLELMKRVDADVLIVNDPDADRMGCAIKTKSGTPRILSGNEIGVVLTNFLLSKSPQPHAAAVATTVVSTPMTRQVVASYGAHLETTLTGFKWLWTAMCAIENAGQGRFAICWEEALGYSTHRAVRDKDGIAAALAIADWVSDCCRSGIRPIDYLAELYRRHGAWASAPRSVVRPITTGIAEIQRMMSELSARPPRELAGRRVTSVIDFTQGAENRPIWCGASAMHIIELAGEARIVVRPSGTEPKLKCYADVREDVGVGEDPLFAYERARSVAESLNDALVRRLEMVI